ncbi:chloride channel CLIC-like protein 1 [Haliotis rubra]|uniref:chloride channel CLIC-like protein 1 n=1 Tax=Haliotis rubra TaxID=36100 RepID=UPI001EE623A0|nr:chloride channel CLIC-like protein 1 [Haliotis rubra]
MSITMWYMTVVLLCSVVQHCHTEVRMDTDDWIDPYDMVNFNHDTMTMKGKQEGGTPQANHNQDQGQRQVPKKDESITQETESEASKMVEDAERSKGDNPGTCSQPPSPCPALFRQYVKSLLFHMKGKVASGVEELNIRVKVSATEVEYLEQYTSSSSEQNFHRVHEILSSMVQHVSEVSQDDPSVRRLWIENVIGMQVEKFVMFALLAAALVTGMLVAARLHFSWKKLSMKLIFVLFVLSTVWQWVELYKIEEAKQHMAIMKEMPEGCRKRERDEDFMSTVMRTLSSTFTFEKDDCLKYYEHHLIAPLWRATPTQALSRTFIRFFVSPLQDIGEALREFLVGLLKDLPAQLWPVALGGVALFFFLFLFMYFRYSVRLPFWLLSIEPGQREDNSNVQLALQEQGKELKALKEAHSSQMNEIMDVLKKDQQALEQQLANQETILSLPDVRRMVQVPPEKQGAEVMASRSYPMIAGGDRKPDLTGVEDQSNQVFCAAGGPEPQEQLNISGDSEIKNVQLALQEQGKELKALKEAHSSQMNKIMDVLKKDPQALEQQLANQETILSLPDVRRMVQVPPEKQGAEVMASRSYPMIAGGDRKPDLTGVEDQSNQVICAAGGPEPQEQLNISGDSR